MDAKKLIVLFGKRVRSLRLLRGLTQQQLSERSNISIEYLSKIERGQASPSFGTIARLCSGLEVDADQLFNFKDLRTD